MTPKLQPTTPHPSAAARQPGGSGAALTLAIRKMAEEEWQIVRRVPNKGQDDMVLPRAGTLASWIRQIAFSAMPSFLGALLRRAPQQVSPGGMFPVVVFTPDRDLTGLDLLS